MTRSYRSVLLCLLGLALTAPQASGGEGVFSGPQVGERLSPVKVAIAYGRKKGNEVDLLEAAEGRPTLLVFVHGANRPAARLTRALMNYAEMRADDGLFAALIWLADDLSGAEQYMERSISWWGVGLPVGISVDGAEGPGSYGLNRKVNVTVLVAKKNRVTANFALVQPSETDAPKILSEVVKLVGGKTPTAAEVTFLSVPTRKPKTAKWLTAPPDLHFRRLICNLLAATDDAAAKKAARAVDEFAAGDAHRQETLGRVARILSRGRTRVGSIPAARYVRRWQSQAER